MEWINVNDSMPKEGDYCIVKFKHRKERKAQFVNGCFCCTLQGKHRPKLKQENIEYWKPSVI